MNPPLDMLILAVPGPVLNQRADIDQSRVDTGCAALQQALGIPGVRIINDFQAAAAGVATLTRLT